MAKYRIVDVRPSADAFDGWETGHREKRIGRVLYIDPEVTKVQAAYLKRFCFSYFCDENGHSLIGKMFVPSQTEDLFISEDNKTIILTTINSIYQFELVEE